MFAAAVQPASAKSVSLIPAPCSLGTDGFGVVLQAGSLVTVGFGANGVSSAGTWHILIGEAGAPPMIDYTAALGQNWTVVTNRTLTSGFHVVSVNVNNLITGETCTTQFQFLVGGGGGGGGGVAIAQPDIQLGGSASAGTPAAGATYSYTFLAKNSGNAIATAVAFTDVLPVELSGAAFQSVTKSDGSACLTPAIGDQIQISCDLGDIAAGAQKTVTVTVSAPATPGAVIVNTATAYPTNVEKSLGNNDRTISVTVR